MSMSMKFIAIWDPFGATYVTLQFFSAPTLKGLGRDQGASPESITETMNRFYYMLGTKRDYKDLLAVRLASPR